MDEFASSNLKETLDKIDQTIEDRKAIIQRGKNLEKLMTMPEFIDVILNGYIDEEAKRLFEILIDPTGASPYSDEKIQMKLASVTDMKGYLHRIKLEAERAPLDIMREETYRKEVTAEAAGEEI